MGRPQSRFPRGRVALEPAARDAWIFGSGACAMARRVLADISRDLVLALLALRRRLVDQAQLLGAFEVWTRAEDRSMAELLVERGTLDARGRALTR